MKRISIICLLAMSLYIGVCFQTVPVNAYIGTITTSSIADADTYVSSRNPTTNYGVNTVLKVAEDEPGHFWEAYLHFNFSDKPTNFEKAEISLRLFAWSGGASITISLINSTWNESTMTWNTKPNHDNILYSFTWTGYGIYKFDVTNYIEGTGISICVNATNTFQDDEINIKARDGWPSYAPEEAPQLIWTYQGEVGYSILSPTSSENLAIGFHTILWTTIWASDTVNIYLYKGSNLAKTIATDIDNSGIYDTWYIYRGDYFEGDDYRIKLVDYENADIYGFSDYLRISSSGTFNFEEDTPPQQQIPGYNLMIILCCSLLFIYIAIKKRKN